MSKYVYLAGPIAGCSYGEATDWRKEACGWFGPGIIGISPMRMKEWYDRLSEDEGVEQYEAVTNKREFLLSGESHAIKTRDFFDVRSADLLLVHLPKAMNDRQYSAGTLIEIGWASAYSKPIVLITDDETLATHPLVRESVGWIVPDLLLGVEVVNSILSAYI